MNTLASDRKCIHVATACDESFYIRGSVKKNKNNKRIKCCICFCRISDRHIYVYSRDKIRI
jgi:hypothetical protein